MGVRLASVSTTTNLASPAAALEVIVVTTPAINLTLDGALVLLSWYLIFTVGTTGTSYQARIRRGTAVTGTLINVGANVTATAGNVVVNTGSYVDSPGIVSGQQYSLGLIVNGATAISTVADNFLAAMVL